MYLLDIEAQVFSFETRFAELQAKAKQDLINQKKSVKVVNTKLMKALPPRIEKDYCRFVQSRHNGYENDLDEFFDDIKAYCQNCFEFEILELIIISNNCHSSLRNAVKEYGTDVRYFKQSTSISELMITKLGQHLMKQKPCPRGYKKLTTHFDISPDVCKVILLDRFREDVWSNPNLSSCNFRICSINTGSVRVDWAILEEFRIILSTLFCIKDGKQLLQKYQIQAVSIDDIVIDKSVRCDKM